MMPPAGNWPGSPPRDGTRTPSECRLDQNEKTFTMKIGITELKGHIVDVVSGKIYTGTVTISEGRILSVQPDASVTGPYILPGLIDAHIHVESSMLIPSEFARVAVIHGTVGTVSDPHEIANVLGTEGVRFMIANGRKTPFRFAFGAPSCVPATPFESSGAALGVAEVGELLAMPEVRYLSEMMNFPGVLAGDPEVMEKLALAARAGKPVDGHAPGLSGPDAARYIAAGISTDHECYTLEEAREKIAYGMHILIREGSAARNFDTLCPLIDEFPDRVMLCSDDKHPDDLVRGHINVLVRRALAKGLDPMNVFRSCTLNPAIHYGLEAGLLRPGDPADLIVADNLENFTILETYIGGERVAANGRTCLGRVAEEPRNAFSIGRIGIEEIRVPANGSQVRVIGALEGQLVTESLLFEPTVAGGFAISDPSRDLLKIVVRNRYRESPAAVAFIRNFGLRRGAIASSVAHDSHNIVAVGADDEAILEAINLIVDARGGISVVDGADRLLLPLPFAGIMSGDDAFGVAGLYEEADRRARALGSRLAAPFMTLSFMALLVIPELKLSDRGLFDGGTFSFTPLFKP